MADTKIAILGGKGMLGTDLAIECNRQKLETIVLDLPEFDITNMQNLHDNISDCEIIINCAAYTNVEKAESQPDLAYKVNAEAVGKLGSFAKKNDIWIMHISTDFVFDGKNSRPYIETDPTNPINTYGKSKLAGEKLLVESGCRHCIIRLEWTYGSAGNNFVKKLLAKAKQGEKVTIVDDQIGSPTATTQVAEAISKLLPQKLQGLFHFAAAEYVSRFKMAEFIFDKLNMIVDLSSCRTSDYKSAAIRPLNSCFNCDKIQDVLNEKIENWQKPLERFLRQL